jgi:DNA-binding transcriptional ArsR family regulator
MAAESHPRHDLVPELNSPVRLSILAALARVEEMDFASLRDVAELSDATLSKQLSQLENSGLVVINKVFVGKRPKTWVRISPGGTSALARHMDALMRLTGRAQTATEGYAGTPPMKHASEA